MALGAYAKGGAREPARKPSQKIPVEPMVLSIHLPNNAASATDFAVFVPWKNCRLAHATATVLVAVDTVAVMDVDLELNAASGTAMYSIDVAGAAGAQVDGTLDSAAACNNLDRDDDARNVINLEVTGSTTGSGEAMIYMYFEEATNAAL